VELALGCRTRAILALHVQIHASVMSARGSTAPRRVFEKKTKILTDRLTAMPWQALAWVWEQLCDIVPYCQETIITQ
jgi:hypothetical protein